MIQSESNYRSGLIHSLIDSVAAFTDIEAAAFSVTGYGQISRAESFCQIDIGAGITVIICGFGKDSSDGVEDA